MDCFLRWCCLELFIVSTSFAGSYLGCCKHRATTIQRDEYKGRSNQAYDAYVTQTHEGYVLQEDFAALEAQNTALTERKEYYLEETGTLQVMVERLQTRNTALLLDRARLMAVMREVVEKTFLPSGACRFCGVYVKPHQTWHDRHCLGETAAALLAELDTEGKSK